jgi:hypothetical protein
MTAESDFAGVVAQIKAELQSVGRLLPGAIPGRGVDVIVCSELPAGWLGISDSDGRQAFGPASEILIMVQNYVRRVREEGERSINQPGSLWSLIRDSPSEPNQAQGE